MILIAFHGISYVSRQDLTLAVGEAILAGTMEAHAGPPPAQANSFDFVIRT